MAVWQRVEREALLRLKTVLSLQLDNLYRFNKRFAPRWSPRYVIYQRRLDLPRIAVAAMAAEGYLHLPGANGTRPQSDLAQTEPEAAPVAGR